MLRPMLRPMLREDTRGMLDRGVGDLTGAIIAGFFGLGEQGAFYDPSDFSTLFQDSAGTTPVTAAGQPVGLMLDKRLGLARGAELRQTGTVFLIGSATAATYDTATGAGTATRVDASNRSSVRISGLPANTRYEVSVTCTGGLPTNIRDGAATPQVVVSAGQTRTAIISSEAAGQIEFDSNGAGTTQFTVNSVRSLLGNHATQPTAAARPTLQQDASGFWHLRPDGVDDWMQTGSIDFSASDKVWLWSGMRKESDAARSMLMELGNALAAGYIQLNSPVSAGANFQINAAGSLASSVTAIPYAAPTTRVLSGGADIAGGSLTLRVDGTAFNASASLGTGNYSNAPLFLFARGGTTFFYNGRFYGGIIRAGTPTAAQIALGERWAASKCGVSLP